MHAMEVATLQSRMTIPIAISTAVRHPTHCFTRRAIL